MTTAPTQIQLTGLNTSLVYLTGIAAAGALAGWLLGGKKHRQLGGIIGMVAGAGVAMLPPVNKALVAAGTAAPVFGAPHG